MNMEFSAYAITIRPADGITDTQIEAVRKVCLRMSDYCAIITEKSGSERHLHAGLFLKKPTKKGTLNVRLRELNAFKALSGTEKYVMNQGTKIMYNMDFINEYMDKDDETVVIHCELPPQGMADSYFPPKEEQQKAMKQARINTAKSKQLQNLEELWNEHVPPGTPCTIGNCRDYLFEWTFEKRYLKVWQRKADFRHLVETMFYYINKRRYCPATY